MSKLSIVTITRNNYEELVETQKSLKAISDYHHIVINGGKCKKTKRFLIEQEIDHISEPDKGIADAFNKGIGKFLENGSKYVVFINSGDRIWDASYFIKATDFLEINEQFSFTYGDIIFEHTLYGNIHGQARKLFDPTFGMPCPHPTMIYRKSVFEKVGLFNCSYKIAMDYHHICRMFKAGLRGKYVAARPSVLMDGGGISSTHKILEWKECRQALIDTKMLYSNKKNFFIGFLWASLREELAYKLKYFLANFKIYNFPITVPTTIDWANLPPKTFVIVINSYKRDVALVKQNLECSLSQNPSPRKVVFFDHNDEKLQLKQEMAENPLLDHLHVPKKSFSVARNSLNIFSDVGWIIFCDDAGCLMKDYTKKFFETIECRPWVEIIGGPIVCDDNGNFFCPKHKAGKDPNKFHNIKIMTGSNFACRVETFRNLGGFDERFVQGSPRGSGEDTDFFWKAHASRSFMIYCPDLKAFGFNCQNPTGFKNFSNAFLHGKGRGISAAKWIFEERRREPLYEMAEVSLVAWLQMFRSALTFSLKKLTLSLIVLTGYYWGFIFFGGKLLFSNGRIKTSEGGP